MAEYSITLPDGTCIEGDEPHIVSNMALRQRDLYVTFNDSDDEEVRSRYEDEDSKTLQERVDEAYSYGQVD